MATDAIELSQEMQKKIEKISFVFIYFDGWSNSIQSNLIQFEFNIVSDSITCV